MKYQKQNGFTAIELLITIIVAGLFAVTFYQLFITINTSISTSKQRALANDLSYSYLRKYASVTAPTITCNTTTDVTQNATAAGVTLESGTLTREATGLPSPITYQVVALAIYGCKDSHTQSPLKIEAQVRFGPDNILIKHGTLVSY